MGDQLMTIRLNGSDLTVTQVMAVARHGEAVALAPEAVAAMCRARVVVQDVLAGDEPVYGLTTGVGERKAFLLDPAERRQFNLRLVLNHGSPRATRPRPTWSAARCSAWPTATPRASPASGPSWPRSVPAGSADLPLHPAHPRRGQGRAGLRPDHPGARAQLLAVQSRRGGACG